MSSDWKNMAVVSASTVGSRVLGLLRDMATYALLGAGALNSAFLLAFTLPNLFRRLLGEGALSSATIPVLSEEQAKGGEQAFFLLLNQVLTRLGIVLLGLVLMGNALFACILWPPSWLGPTIEAWPERWQTGAGLGLVLLSYTLFICLAAILGAALNVRSRFSVAALSQVWLNGSILLFLVIGWLWSGPQPVEIVGWLCLGVLVGGLLQVSIPAVALAREGWSPHFDLRPSPSLERIMKLFLPATLGAAILQINGVVSRLIGFSLDDTATALLYLASRLIELPLGVFAVAVVTVLFPKLARLYHENRGRDLAKAYGQGQQIVLAFCLPATIGLIVLREPIVRLLFEWGAFTAADTAAATEPLWIYALALPFYGYSALATRVFHASQNTSLPVRAAALNFCLNLSLSLLLMGPLGISGLALAGLIGGAAHAASLRWMLRNYLLPVETHTVRAIGAVFSASLVMGACVEVMRLSLEAFQWTSKSADFALLGGGIPAAAALYFVLLKILRFPAMEEMVQVLKRKMPGGG
jgi:putative peptidoglycan lipid II flippase